MSPGSTLARCDLENSQRGVSVAREQPAGLPFTVVRTAVHVQHLPGDMARFREIEHRASDVLRCGDRTHRRQGLQEILRVVLVKWSVDDSGCDRIEADV